MKNKIKEAREWLKTKGIHGSPIVYDINSRSQSVEDLLVEFAEHKQTKSNPMFEFKSIEEFDSFAREYSDEPVNYEHGNWTDFYAHIVLRSGDLLSFEIEFNDEVEAIVSDEDVYEVYLEEVWNKTEAFNALKPREIFEKFPEQIKVIMP